jgi:hypothetical protein
VFKNKNNFCKFFGVSPLQKEQFPSSSAWAKRGLVQQKKLLLMQEPLKYLSFSF